jgi:hypothetical protein
MCNKASTRSPSSAGAEHKPILAERFKTKMCANYVKTGSCPYEVRCMFAHGEHEMRTKEMNLRDRLVTEDSIKNFQRAKMIADRSVERKKKRLTQAGLSPLVPPTEDAGKEHFSGEPATPPVAVRKEATAAHVDTPTRTLHPSFAAAAPETPETLASRKSPDVDGGCAVTPIRGLDLASPTLTGRYRHNPYASVPLKLVVTAVCVGGRPLGDAPSFKSFTASRTRALPIPTPLCAVELSHPHASNRCDAGIPLCIRAHADLPNISPLALVMGRQSNQTFHSRNHSSAAVAPPTPPETRPPPSTPEYKTTYGAPCITSQTMVFG